MCPAPTPWCLPGAFAQFFPSDSGLTLVTRCSAHETIPAMRFRQGDEDFGAAVIRLPSGSPPFARPSDRIHHGQSTWQPSRLRHASPGQLPDPGSGIATIFASRFNIRTGMQPWKKTCMRKSAENPLRSPFHSLLMILRRKQMPVSIHGHLQAGMPGKTLHRLRRQPTLNPGRNCKMPKRVPIEGRNIDLLEQWLEPSLDHIVMA